MRRNSIRSEKPRDMREKPRKQPTSTAFPSRIDEEKTFRNFYRNHDVLVDFVIALVVDCYNIIPSLRKADLARDVKTIRRRFEHEGVGFATRTLPNLFTCILSYMETGELSFPGFKCKTYRSGSVGPVFLQQLIEPILNVSLDDADKVIYIDCLYQVCVAFKKLKGPYRSSVLRSQLTDFVETDISLIHLYWRSASLKGIRQRARDIVSQVIQDLDPDIQEKDFIPRPGPGATNTPTEKHERFRPHVLYTQLNDEFPYEDWFYSHPWDIVDDPKKHPWFLKQEDAPTSRFKFVPKTYGKPRGICIEQLEAQYLQQGVKNALVKRLESHPFTKGRVNFASQEVNRRLAKESSFHQELATIDMSEASDRVSRDLVGYMFSGNEPLLNKLMALSTRTIELPDEINFIANFPANKFAPMGSALCFPVMSLIHFAVVTAIIECSYGRKNKSPVWVYGDDIIIPSRYTQTVYDLLPNFGMKLNVSKSYVKSRFRESCGMHAYNGCEITPVYFKSIPHFNSGISDMISFIKTEGQLHKKGFHMTCQKIRAEFFKVKRLRAFHSLPKVNAFSPVLGWIREKGDSLDTMVKNNIGQMRTNPYLLCNDIRLMVVVPRLKDATLIDQNEGYLRWLLVEPNSPRSITELYKKEDYRLQPSISTAVKGTTLELTIKRRWLPESALLTDVLGEFV